MSTRQTFPDNLIFASAAPELDAPNASVYSYAYESGAGKTPPKAGVHNAVFKRSDLQHQHVERNGIPKYDPRTVYDLNGLTLSNNGSIYQSRSQGNTNQEPESTPSQWRFVISAQKVENIDAAIAAHDQSISDNKNAISRNKNSIDSNVNQINLINKRLDTLFIEYMKNLFPVKSAVMRPVDPGLPVSQGGLGFGTWQDKSGRVPIGAGTYTDANGDTNNFGENGSGGEFSHKLTIPEIPSHDHIQVLPQEYGGNQFIRSLVATSNNDERWVENNRTRPTGGDESHNNIQPWFGVKIWYRVA